MTKKTSTNDSTRLVDKCDKCKKRSIAFIVQVHTSNTHRERRLCQPCGELMTVWEAGQL